MDGRQFIYKYHAYHQYVTYFMIEPIRFLWVPMERIFDKQWINIISVINSLGQSDAKQAIIWTNAGILSIEPSGQNSRILIHENAF